MGKGQKVVDIISIIWGFSTLIVGLVVSPSLETQFIPTVINGMATTVGLVVGFTLTSLTLAVTKLMPEPSKFRMRIASMLFFLFFSVLLLFSTFAFLAHSHYERAFKTAVVAFGISVAVLFNFVSFLGLESLKP